MRPSIMILCSVVITLCSPSYSQSIDSGFFAQTSRLQATIEAIPLNSLNYIDRKYSKLTDDVQAQSEKVLTRIQEKEMKLQQKLQSTDTTKAKEFFLQSQAKYQELKDKLNAPISKIVNNHYAEYIPGIDSLQSLMKFLSLPNSNLTIPAD